MLLALLLELLRSDAGPHSKLLEPTGVCQSLDKYLVKEVVENLSQKHSSGVCAPRGRVSGNKTGPWPHKDVALVGFDCSLITGLIYGRLYAIAVAAW